MFRTITCLSHHSPWLLAVAVLVCLAATATTMRLYCHGRSLRGPGSLLWLIGGGVSGGAGIWATHFVSMLAYEPGLPTGYESFGTLMSLLIAAVGVSGGLIVAAKAKHAAGHAFGGGVVGVTIAAMHYTGMSAFRTAGVLIWDPVFVTVAIVGGVVFGALSLVVVSRRPTLAGATAGAVLLVLGIVCLHFVSMAAVTILPNANLQPPTSVLPNQVMALGVGGLVGLIMIGAAAILLIDTRNQRRTLVQLNSVIEAMPDGLAYYDAQDRYLLWNAKYETTMAEFGLKPERGRTDVDSITSPGASEEAAALITRRLAGRSDASSSHEAQSPNGRWIRVEENCTADGGRVSVVFDISTLKETARELAIARDAAEDANRAKSEFLANMSHEIRTPLNGVLGVADALALGPLDRQQSELVEIIRTSGQVLNRLLCDILDLARVESGELQLLPQPFNLAEAVRDVAELSAVHAREKGLDFKLKIARQADRVVAGDPVRLKQILTTLTSNAIKFTDQGEATLEITCLDDAASRFSMVVRDTGCGFDGETRARLFGRFHQGDSAMNRRAGGSGLGLAIARQLAELMGGELDAESVEGEGAVFTLRLTLPRTAQVDARQGAPSPMPESDHQTRILIIDDNANNRRVMQVLLEHIGAETRAASDGQEGLDAWRSSEFDVVIMDMQMPVMDGLAATRAIREVERREGRRRTPIIFVSANAMPEQVDAAHAAGGDGHVAKPVAAEALFAALSSLHLDAAA